MYGFHSGQLVSLTNPIHEIPGQFVNKPGKRLFFDRALLICDVFSTWLHKILLLNFYVFNEQIIVLVYILSGPILLGEVWASMS